MRELFGWDARARVRDGACNRIRSLARYTNRDGASRGRETQGVADEVLEHLRQPVAIGRHERSLALDRALERSPTVRRLRTKLLAHLGRECRHVDPLELD